jgi:biotin carboxyl carrier protein
MAAERPAWLVGPVKFAAELNGQAVSVEVTEAGGQYRVALGDDAFDVDARQPADGIWSLVIGGASYVAEVSERDGVSTVVVDGEPYQIRVEEESRYIIRTRGGKAAAGGQVLKAPMPGKVVHIDVGLGQTVQPGDALIVLEAMKMENEFRAAAAGQVAEIRVQVGQTVNPGDVLLVIN